MLICKEVIGMQEIRSIALWGDSVMRGVVYDEQRGRYGLLPENAADRASRTLGLTLYNRSRMGCTVTKGLSIICLLYTSRGPVRRPRLTILPGMRHIPRRVSPMPWSIA